MGAQTGRDTAETLLERDLIMEYLRVPDEISTNEVRANALFPLSLSPSTYCRVIIPTNRVRPVQELLRKDHPFDKGKDPGSAWYMHRSSKHFIRTKALQNHSSLLSLEGDAVVPLNPRVFVDPLLVDGDILMSKDSNVGESAIVDGDRWKDHMFSGGIVRLHPQCDRHYFFAFLKHPIFIIQLSPTPRGATIIHAKPSLWLDCQIPFPNQEDDKRVVQYVSVLMQAILNKEKVIVERYSSLVKTIENELSAHQTPQQFSYDFPTASRLSQTGRLDAGFWSENLARELFRIRNYSPGAYNSIFEADPPYALRRGPNLAVSVSGKGYYFDQPIGEAYRLVTPGDITDHMTLSRVGYYASPRRFDLVQHGEILFAAKGNREVSIGHTYVHLSHEPILTNYDSFIIDSGDLTRNIFLAAFLNYCKTRRVFARLSDSSNGGSFVENHFNYLPIPRFSDDKQEEIARFYHNASPSPTEKITVETLVESHCQWDSKLGIWELDQEMKALRETLSGVQRQIIEGKKVVVPL
jgi:type I restriction enzyme S subunit